MGPASIGPAPGAVFPESHVGEPVWPQNGAAKVEIFIDLAPMSRHEVARRLALRTAPRNAGNGPHLATLSHKRCQGLAIVRRARSRRPWRSRMRSSVRDMAGLCAGTVICTPSTL